MKFYQKLQLYIWLIKEFIKDLLTPEKFPPHIYSKDEIDELTKDRAVEMMNVKVIDSKKFQKIMDDVKKKGEEWGRWIEGYSIEEAQFYFGLTKTMIKYLLKKPVYYYPMGKSYLFHRKRGNVWWCMTKKYYRKVKNELWGQK